MAETSIVVGVRIPPDLLEKLKNLSYQISLNTGEDITHNDIIRRAINAYINTIDPNSMLFEQYSEMFNGIEMNKFSQEFDNIVTRAMHSVEGRNDLSCFIIGVVDDFIVNNSLARKILEIDAPGPSCLPRYEGIKFVWSGTSRNDCIEKNDFEETILPYGEVASNFKVKLTNVRNISTYLAHSNIFEAAKRATLEILHQEETILFKALMAASKNHSNYILDDFAMYVEKGDTVIVPKCHAQLIVSMLNKDKIEKEEKERFFYSDFEASCAIKTINDINFLITNNNHMSKTVILNKNKSEIGIIVYKNNSATILPADDPLSISLGWSMFEEIALGISDRPGKFFIA